MQWSGNSRPRLMPCSGSSASATRPPIILMPGHTPPESCHPPPDPASHSPRIARAATMRRSDSLSVPSSEVTCPVARMQTATIAASKLVDTASREPLGMSFTLLNDLQPQPRPDDSRKHVGQALLRAFQPRRNQTRGDDRRLKQPQVVFGEVEDLGQRRDVGLGPQVERWPIAAPARR